MKNLILTIAAVISLSTITFATNIEDGSLAIVKSEKVEVILENETQKKFIVSSVFEEDNNNIALVFESTVNMIQVFDTNGDLEMMLPIDSSKVNLGMSLFAEGSYRIGFMVEGLSEVQYTSLQVK